jgi:hypothetical protein
MKEVLVTIPESIVREAAEECKDDSNNGFLRCLIAGEEFRAAGLTPIYILDENYMDLVVVAKETYKKKLN